MSDKDIIKIPIIKPQIPIIEPPYIEGKKFYNNYTSEALAATQEAGYRAMFMPELVDARIFSINLNKSRIWDFGWTTPSLIATGKSKQGNGVVVFAHVDNYFSDPSNIKTAIDKGLVKGAGIMPESDFYALLDMEDDKNVFVVDHKKLKYSISDLVPVKYAMKHPQTIPFLGGEERAEQYLQKLEKYSHMHENFYGEIGIWHPDDLCETPLGRLLFLGSGYSDIGSLFGDFSLNSEGRFLGVRPCAVDEEDRQKTAVPSLENILEISRKFVPDVAKSDFEKQISSLYNL